MSVRPPAAAPARQTTMEMASAALPAPLRHAAAAELQALYGPARAPALLDRLEGLLAAQRAAAPAAPPAAPLTQRDALLITYADQVQAPGEAPLRTLAAWLERRLAGVVRGVHLLPFYPWSSDDGFSVIDYEQVDPRYGTWDDVGRLAGRFRLMVDAVLNHVSAESAWFRGYLAGDPRYRDFFISVDPQTDLSAVVRPRDLPLLTPFETAQGTRHVWTTFSADQIDLNYAEPEVLFAVLRAVLGYVRRGAQLLRLDAVAFAWKEIGTPCIHLPQAHALVRLLRVVLEAAAPGVRLITETNVPHEENLSYFGDGTNEAHLVYQFALPPLVLHTFLGGDAARLTDWAAALRLPSDQVSFFNFLASHDGIGVRPAHGILDEGEIDRLVSTVEARGGRVSYRRVGRSERQPYELNISYLDALTPAGEAESQPARTAARFLAAHAILLSLAGLPGLYVHSLVGSRNDHAGVERSGVARAINRARLDRAELEQELARESSLRRRVFDGMLHLLRARAAHPAFHPAAPQRVLDLGPQVFALLRGEAGKGGRVLCLHPVAGEPLTLRSGLRPATDAAPIDLLSGRACDADRIELEPFQAAWIALEGSDGP